MTHIQKNITVKCFDVYKAEEELKKCPKIIRDYVKLLKEQTERWKALQRTTMKKLISKALNNGDRL